MHILFRIPPKQNVEICNRKNAKRSLLTNVWFFFTCEMSGGKKYMGMKTALVKLLLSYMWSINQPLKFGSFRMLEMNLHN